MTKEQQDSVNELVRRGFEFHTYRMDVVTLVRTGIRSALYADVSPNGKVNGDALKKFLRRLKFWIRKQDRRAITQ